ncbi:hypothetical protein NHQ30_010698 [Ciborinia camelliae]|nr:hypothetical protein NHQ30_010698 [Ciborinia camelliae]
MMAKSSVFSFDYCPSVAEFAVSKHSYLAARPGISFGYIATSAFVLDVSSASNPRLLLLQRAASDSDPNTWEPPGGACEDKDESILHAAARELWEEAGLQAARIDGTIGDPYHFTLSDGKQVCRFHFVVQLKINGGALPAVGLNPCEHQRFVWATRDEIRERKANGMVLEFTTREVEQTSLLVFDYFE